MSPSAVSPDRDAFEDVSTTSRKDSGCDVSDNNGNASSSPRLSRADDGEIHDLICIGFGPASLAIAVAIHDKLETNHLHHPKVRFLERQHQFGWHAGMLLPGTKMQISFIKDLATLRDPRSKFTFLNYLQEKKRLVQFSNLDTFLPFRVEFEDYLKWAAAHFANVVDYGQSVENVRPVNLDGGEEFDCLEVSSRSHETGRVTRLLTRNVVIAVGGRPSKPKLFPDHLQRVIHSSQYKHNISQLLPENNKKYNIAVVGSGQSAAEIFHDLHSKFPNAQTQMVIRDSALRPSDDSPFVNEVFNPDAVDAFFTQTSEERSKAIRQNRATNYSVVRLNLLETIYEELYNQYLREPDKENWQHRILATRQVVDAQESTSKDKIFLTLENTNHPATESREVMELDAVILATGYVRDVHTQMLKECQVINAATDGTWKAGRHYQVDLNRQKASKKLGIWLQGCNEQTHGLADSLLSVLATRSGELVEAVFGDQRPSYKMQANGNSHHLVHSINRVPATLMS